MDTVAEHVARASQIAYFLAVMEGYPEPEKVVTAVVFHDIGECRVGDLHKIANRYVISKEATAVADQLAPLETAGKTVMGYWKETEEVRTVLGIIAKDADRLELAFTAKEIKEKGYAYAEDWITNIGTMLKTPSAKKLLAKMRETDSNSWWQGLKKLEKQV